VEVIIDDEVIFGEVTHTHTLIKYQTKILLQINNYHTVPQIFE
jgi:hypothetical protein